MLAFPSTMRIFLAVEPVDMRKQFNGLWAVAQDVSLEGMSHPVLKFEVACLG
jgi:hypothetical protein